MDSVVGDNIPILTEQEKFNEAVSSIVKRVSAKLTGAHCGGSCGTPRPVHAHQGSLTGGAILACMRATGDERHSRTTAYQDSISTAVGGVVLAHRSGINRSRRTNIPVITL